MSQENIKNPHTADATISPELIHKLNRFGRMKFKGICLNKTAYLLFIKKVVNLYIQYKLDKWKKDLNTDFTPGNWLFGAGKLTKYADPDRYKYSCYGIGFYSRSQLSWTDGSAGKNVIIFGVDNSSSVHIDGRNKNYLVCGDGATQG